jgi:hypothetical protein
VNRLKKPQKTQKNLKKPQKTSKAVLGKIMRTKTWANTKNTHKETTIFQNLRAKRCAETERI